MYEARSLLFSVSNACLASRHSGGIQKCAERWELMFAAIRMKSWRRNYSLKWKTEWTVEQFPGHANKRKKSNAAKTTSIKEPFSLQEVSIRNLGKVTTFWKAFLKQWAWDKKNEWNNERNRSVLIRNRAQFSFAFFFSSSQKKQNLRCDQKTCKTNAYYISTLWPLYGPAGSTQGRNQLFIGHCSLSAESQSQCRNASLCFQPFSFSNFLSSFSSSFLCPSQLPCTQINRVYLRVSSTSSSSHRSRGTVCFMSTGQQFFSPPPPPHPLPLSNKQIWHNKSAAGSGEGASRINEKDEWGWRKWTTIILRVNRKKIGSKKERRRNEMVNWTLETNALSPNSVNIQFIPKIIQ